MLKLKININNIIINIINRQEWLSYVYLLL